MKRALVLNVGSSTLKWATLDLDSERLEGGDTVDWKPEAGAESLAPVLEKAGAVDVVGHRVVHGGERFVDPVVVDDGVRAALAELTPLDPLHLPPALAAIDAARKALPKVPHVAAFDTAFHATLPEAARTYAVPKRWRDEAGVRRFGFHGLSVEHAVRRAAELLGGEPERLVVCHLGSGSSLTAVRAGRSVDTTMGLTPAEGVVMSTRAGSIDPGIFGVVAAKLGLDVQAIDRALNKESGLSALAGTSDLREIRRAGTKEAELAAAVLTHSVTRALGAMIASLGGVDAVVFTGGIGENDARLRADVALAFTFAGVALETEANEEGRGDRRISSAGVAVLVVHAREDLSILRAIRRALA
jgi:acetate kinase